MTFRYNPSPGWPFCGYGCRSMPWWEPWVVLAACGLIVVLGWLVGGR